MLTFSLFFETIWKFFLVGGQQPNPELTKIGILGISHSGCPSVYLCDMVNIQYFFLLVNGHIEMQIRYKFSLTFLNCWFTWRRVLLRWVPVLLCRCRFSHLRKRVLSYRKTSIYLYEQRRYYSYHYYSATTMTFVYSCMSIEMYAPIWIIAFVSFDKVAKLLYIEICWYSFYILSIHLIPHVNTKSSS